jgi:predicted peptidase
MAGLTGKSIASAYKSILRVDDDSNGIDTSVESITDGEGTASALSLSDDQLLIRPQNDDTTTAFSARDKSNNVLLAVDSTNSVVKAGVGQFNVLTQYAYFGIGTGLTSTNTAGYHYPLYFSSAFNMGIPGFGDQVNHFGNGADPATSFTTAAATDQKANDLVGYMMYVPDNISVDAVYSIEGADAATGDTTRFHLMSYTFNSGSTSCLTDGTLVAHSDDTTNAGSEQVYKSTWNIDNASVAGGKVLICTFESDSVNSDYSYQAIIKYHLV